jgi:hypothetical protein
MIKIIFFIPNLEEDKSLHQNRGDNLYSKGFQKEGKTPEGRKNELWRRQRGRNREIEIEQTREKSEYEGSAVERGKRIKEGRESGRE